MSDECDCKQCKFSCQPELLTKEEATAKVISAAREAARLPGNRAALTMLKIALETLDDTVIAAQDVDRE